MRPCLLQSPTAWPIAIRKLLIVPLLAASLHAQAGDHGFEVIHHFTGPGGTGAVPQGGLAQGTDGHFRGAAVVGSKSGWGEVYRLSSSGRVVVLHNFRKKGTEGYGAYSDLALASDGSFYGSNAWGGSGGGGTIFRISPSGEVTLVHALDAATEGASPGSLVQADDGKLYGSTVAAGGGCCGSLFRVSLAGVFESLHTFDGADGSSPNPLIQGTDGNLYGTAKGSSAGGSVFRMTPTGVLTVLHQLSPEDGTEPWGALVEGTDGNLYGTTRSQGQFGGGTIFRITPAGVFTVLHSFEGNGGFAPLSALTLASDGSFFGTTFGGGKSDCGTVFRMSADGATVKTVHQFTGADGCRPVAAPILAADGRLYGTAYAGGANGYGTAYRIKER